MVPEGQSLLHTPEVPVLKNRGVALKLRPAWATYPHLKGLEKKKPTRIYPCRVERMVLGREHMYETASRKGAKWRLCHLVSKV